MESASIFGWILFLIVLLVVGFIAVVHVKRWASKEDEVGENFTLSDLRRLQKTGQISAEEYEKARAAIVALAQRAQPKPETKLSGDTIVPPSE